MLTLPIKKKWFDMILSGEKKEEYREIKPYYTARFSKLFEISKEELVALEKFPFTLDSVYTTQVRFRNGYASTSPSFIAKVSLDIDIGEEKWGAVPKKRYYILRIREITERTGIQ